VVKGGRGDEIVLPSDTVMEKYFNDEIIIFFFVCRSIASFGSEFYMWYLFKLFKYCFFFVAFNMS
jgi:hypothetical protein